MIVVKLWFSSRTQGWAWALSIIKIRWALSGSGLYEVNGLDFFCIAPYVSLDAAARMSHIVHINVGRD